MYLVVFTILAKIPLTKFFDLSSPYFFASSTASFIATLYDEELKNRLKSQGYFDESHKQKIPLMPKTIGVLTSQTGSVIRDIINVSTRRNPNVNIRLLPVPVQLTSFRLLV